MILKALTLLFAPFVLVRALIRGGKPEAGIALADIKAVLRGEW